MTRDCLKNVSIVLLLVALATALAPMVADYYLHSGIHRSCR